MAIDWDYYGSIEALEDRMAELAAQSVAGTATDVEYAHKWLNFFWGIYEARRGETE